MNTLVVGSGGREHALCWSLSRSPLCGKLYCTPGNAGIAAIAECLSIGVDNIDAIVAICQEKRIEYVVIGPELPLTLGLADALRNAGIDCFGPSKAAAELEGSKAFMKDVCTQAKVPTANYQRFTSAEEAKNYVRTQGTPLVVKADGLAAGKGVTIAHTNEVAFSAIDDALVKKIFGPAGTVIVIEEFLEGEEVSFFALCDGDTALPFAAAQDHKAAYDGDKGPNTGGMGAYSPAPIFDAAMQERVMREIITPTVEVMKKMGKPFTGVLFAGLMITAAGPKLLEYNVRFGDPETEAILPRLKSDLLAVLYAATRAVLDGITLKWYDSAALCVIMAAEGYPGNYKKNTKILGLNEAQRSRDAIVFHAGTSRNDTGEIIASGGRVLAVTGWGTTIADAQKTAYQAVDKIQWKEGFCRRDIGWRAVGGQELSRKISG